MIEASHFFERRTLGLLLVGGMHHILHLVPIAAELETDRNLDVIVYVKCEAEKKACENTLAAMGTKRTQVKVLKSNAFANRISPKLSFLLSNLKIWNALDAIIVAERTSTILRYFSKNLPHFIHIPHGAGDRAKSYDPRIRHFDHVLVAGEKDKKRMLELGLVQDESCHVTGYIKPRAVQYISPQTPVIFNNTNPIVLYNAHFCQTLSSWETFGHELLQTFSQHQDFNFIIAPHTRLFECQDESRMNAIEAFSKYDNIHVDLGSENSWNMTYTRAADIYLGDISSQVYEFLSRPKPCIFLTKSTTQWEGNPDFAHWRYGPVCHSVEDVMSALTQASSQPAHYAQAQTQGCLAAKGDPSWNPIALAATAVKSILGSGSERIAIEKSVFENQIITMPSDKVQATEGLTPAT